METQEIIKKDLDIKDILAERLEEKNQLRKKFKPEEIAYIKIYDNLTYLRSKQKSYVSNNNENNENNEIINKNIEIAESELKEFLDGKFVLKGQFREMTQKDIAKALEDPIIAKNNRLSIQISLGMVQKKTDIPLKSNKVTSIINNPDVKKYLILIEEINSLNEKLREIRKNELNAKRNEFTETFYKAKLQEIDQEIERQYDILTRASEEKDNLIKDYGMSEEMALEKIPYEDRSAIYESEFKINRLELIKKELEETYYPDFIAKANNESDLLYGIGRLKNFLDREMSNYKIYY